MSEVDVLVVGGGHAGAEAAAAAARSGARTTLVTLAATSLAMMPCNPAVGGVGKGHLVVELDALGGIQGWAADRAGIQFRTLNASRGPAVWGPRVQCDKALYSRTVATLLGRLRHLEVVMGEVVGLDVDGRRVTGVVLADGRRLRARTVILTTGTFLGGVLHTGYERSVGGRFGEPASAQLSGDLVRLGLELERFKTGTPPRLERASLDYERLAPQLGDEPPRRFSFRTRRVANRGQCWLTHTDEAVRRIIEDNLHRSPLFSGAIAGVGPRYCPSIEDKVMRFPHHREHTVFIEPEGLTTSSMYVNGLSTSLPRDVQEAVVHAVPGLEHARFLRYGYAVEYDVVAPGQVGRTLEARGVPGLFVAGQLLGTSGYEEAAALGFVAGVNAVAAVRGSEPLVLGRDQAYIGILVDDLVSRPHREPYRMMTSRAEHRLVLGVDSARERLMPCGVELGLVPRRVFHVEQRRWEARRGAVAELEERSVTPDRETRAWLAEVAGLELTGPTSWAALLARADVDRAALAAVAPALDRLDEDGVASVLATLRYRGTLARAEREQARVSRLRHLPIPAALDLAVVPGLSREVAETLRRERPRTLAEVERLAGMTPAAVALLAGRLAAAEGER